MRHSLKCLQARYQITGGIKEQLEKHHFLYYVTITIFFAANFLFCIRAQFLFNNLFSQKDFFKREGIKKINCWNFYSFSNLQPNLSQSSSGASPIHLPHKFGKAKTLLAAFFLLAKVCQKEKEKVGNSKVKWFLKVFSRQKVKQKKKVKIARYIYLVFIVQPKIQKDD